MCLVNTRAIWRDVKERAVQAANENDSAKAASLAHRSKKQKPGAGTLLKRGLIRKTSSNDKRQSFF